MNIPLERCLKESPYLPPRKCLARILKERKRSGLKQNGLLIEGLKSGLYSALSLTKIIMGRGGGEGRLFKNRNKQQDLILTGIIEGEIPYSGVFLLH